MKANEWHGYLYMNDPHVQISYFFISDCFWISLKFFQICSLTFYLVIRSPIVKPRRIITFFQCIYLCFCSLSSWKSLFSNFFFLSSSRIFHKIFFPCLYSYIHTHVYIRCASNYRCFLCLLNYIDTDLFQLLLWRFWFKI